MTRVFRIICILFISLLLFGCDNLENSSNGKQDNNSSSSSEEKETKPETIIVDDSIEIVIPPKLIQNEGTTTVSFVAGKFSFKNTDDENLPQQTAFTYALENNSSKKIKIIFDSEGTYLELQIINGGRIINTKRSNENLLELYDQSIDGEKYIFESASVTFGKGWKLKGVLKFTPTVCPTELQIPLKRISMNLVPTNEGIEINLDNIPTEASRIEIGRQTANKPDSWWIYIFNSKEQTDKILPSSLSVLDPYVDSGISYNYYVYMNYGNENAVRVASSYITATEGFGRIQINTELSEQGVILTIPTIPLDDNGNGTESLNIRRDDENSEFVEDFYIRNITNNSFQLTDYFVPLNTNITYSININKTVCYNGINGNTNSYLVGYYNIHADKTIKTPMSNCGYGNLEISNSPYASWSDSKITFTTQPELSISNLPPNIIINSIGFIYRKQGDDYRNYYLWNDQTRLSWEQGIYYPSIDAPYGDQGYCIDFSYDQINCHMYKYRDTNSVFENLPQEIVISENNTSNSGNGNNNSNASDIIINIVPSSEGNLLNISNLPSEARGIQIRTEGKGRPLFELFNYNENLQFPSDLQVCDYFVEAGKRYGYRVDVYFWNDENFSNNIFTNAVYSTALGGLGELDFEMSLTADGVLLTFTIPDSITVEDIWYDRYGESEYSFQDISTRMSNNGQFIVTDYFVATNTSYSYEPQIRIAVTVPIDTDNSIQGRYTPAVEPKIIEIPDSNCGYGEVMISNSPAAIWENSKITFTTAPEISISNFPSGVRVSSIGFIYRKVGNDGRNYYLYYGDEKPSWEAGSYYPSELCWTGDKGYYINLRDNNGSSWSVYREPDQPFEGMPQTIVIE